VQRHVHAGGIFHKSVGRLHVQVLSERLGHCQSGLTAIAKDTHDLAGFSHYVHLPFAVSHASNRPTSPPFRQATTRQTCRSASLPAIRPLRKLHHEVSAASRPSPEHVLTVVSVLSEIPLDALQSPSQLRRLGPARAAAAYLLRVDGGLPVKQVAPLLGRSDQTICQFSRNARLGLDRGDDNIAELIRQAREVLAPGPTAVPPTTREPVQEPPPARPQAKPRALAVPFLARWRASTGLTQPQLTRRASIARETIARIEHGRPARLDTILRLAGALTLAPSELTGISDLDLFTEETFRRCKSCGALRPLRGFQARKGTPRVYPRCRACRARCARERYHADPQERAAQARRVQRNRLKRRQAVAPAIRRTSRQSS
jgi:transcriptional regulator with XRE-family HTH domain